MVDMVDSVDRSEMNNLSISEAMMYLNAGKPVRRSADNFYLIKGLGEYPHIVECDLVNMELRRWVPYLIDLLATDWEVVLP